MTEEPQGLLDEDPALDCILFEEVQKEERGGGNKTKGGCQGLLLLMVLPAGAVALGLYFLLS